MALLFLMPDKINVNNSCRCCFMECDVPLNLLQNTYDNIKLKDLYSLYCGVSVQNNDGLPEHICRKCSDAIINFHIFKKKCETTEQIWQQIKKQFITDEGNNSTKKNVKKKEHDLLKTGTKKKSRFKKKLKKKQLQTDVVPCLNLPIQVQTENVSTSSEEGIEMEEIINVNSDKSESNVNELTTTKEYINKQNLSKLEPFENLSIQVRIEDASTSEYISQEIKEKVNVDINKSESEVNELTMTKGYDKQNFDRFSKLELFENEFETEYVSTSEFISEEVKEIEEIMNVGKVKFESEVNELATIKEYNGNTILVKPRSLNKSTSESIELNSINSKSGISSKESTIIGTCPTCNKSFTNKHSLRVHVKNHLVEKKYSCETCGKKFITDYKLEMHSFSHKEIKLFNCIICQKGFNFKQNLSDHMKRHSGLKSYKCTDCEKCFATSGDLIHHNNVHHKTQFQCYSCSKSFKNNTRLKAHERDQHSAFDDSIAARKLSNERDFYGFLCTVCGKLLANRTSFGLHSRIHTGERPHTCSICHKSFTQIGVLKDHISTHSAERPFTCEFCGAGFKVASRLKIHRRSHTGERPYVCPFCKKTFSDSAHLVVHKRIHTGERPYVCEVCNTGFSHLTSMKKHREIHRRKKFSKN